MTVLLLSQSISWMLVVAIALVVAMLFRSVRRLYTRVAPVGALMTSAGPQPGVRLPGRTALAMNGQQVSLGGERPDGRPHLLLFVSGGCPISRKILPIAQDFTQRESIDLLCLGDDTDAMQWDLIRRFGLDPACFVNDAQIGQWLEIDKLPFAMLLDGAGTIVAKGLVNNREHLESLVVAGETGHVSVQSYLDARPRVA